MQTVNSSNTTMDKAQPLYREVSERLERLIEEGTFRSGDRVPSVRALGREWGVSITTVMEAYRLLENRGLIEARPQSGYYVRPRFTRQVPEPVVSSPVCRPTEVTIDRLAQELFRDAANAELVQFGAAIPNPDMLPWEKLNRTLSAVLRRTKASSLAYSTTAGAKALRTELARRAVSAGCSLTPEELVVTNGCHEAVSLCLRVLTRPGDAVAVESPHYFGFSQLLEALGLRALEIPTHPREGMSLEALRYALDHHDVKAVLASPNFSNPLGSLMPDERKRALVDMLAARDIPLIEDDLYGDLSFSEERPRAAKSYDTKGLVMWCSSVSKTLAPGWRIGWVAAGRFQCEVERMKGQTNLATATALQLAMADFLANGGYDHHLRKMRRTLAARTEMVIDAVAEWFPQGTSMTQPQGGYVLWLELPEGIDTTDLYHKARREGVSIAPGVIFSCSNQFRNCLRLNTGYATGQALESLRRVAALIPS